MSFWYWLTVAFLFIGAVAAWGFIPLYHFTAKWWGTFVGRHFMTYSFAIALLYARGVYAFFATEQREPSIVSTVLTGIVSFVVVWRVVVYIRLERMRAQEKRNDMA